MQALKKGSSFRCYDNGVALTHRLPQQTNIAKINGGSDRYRGKEVGIAASYRRYGVMALVLLNRRRYGPALGGYQTRCFPPVARAFGTKVTCTTDSFFAVAVLDT